MAKTKNKAEISTPPMRVQTIEEWLALGNRIKICPPGMRSEDVKEKFGKKRGARKKRAAGKRN